MTTDEVARLEAELAALRASALSLEPVGVEHREIVAHVINELRGWASERASLANWEHQAFEAVHWRETYGWLTEVLGTLPGRHEASWDNGTHGTTWVCWCPIGSNHAAPELPKDRRRHGE